MLKKLPYLLVAFHFVFFFACSDSQKETAQIGTNNTSELVQLSKTDNQIIYYQARIKRAPNKYYNYTKLGEAYIQKGRETGDTAYYSKAEETLKKALELYPDNYTAVVYLGFVNLSKHEFQAVLPYAKKAIELKPENSYAYGILGDADRKSTRLNSSHQL